MKKTAFTMLELVIIIVVVGVIAAFSMPNTKGTDLANASKQVIDHLRYTQHLAMISNKYSGSDVIWFHQNWQIRFFHAGSKNTYAIFNDLDKDGDVDANEVVEDAATNKILGYQSASSSFANSSKLMNLSKKYDIKNIVITYTNASCVGKNSIVFDYYGRPYCDAQDLSSMTGATITITDNDAESVSMSVENETGYVHYN